MDNSKILNAKLFSLQGKQIANCENCTGINTASIANGLYFLNIKTQEGSIRKKILIQH